MSWDGVWQVTTPRLCAGFVIKDNRLVEVAPILKAHGSLFMMEGRIWYQNRFGTTFPAERVTDR